MTGPVVPTPPAEVPQEVAERLKSSRPLKLALAFGVPVGAVDECIESIARDLAPLVERMVAERVRAARVEALDAFIALTNGWPDGDERFGGYAAARGQCKRAVLGLVAELREAQS